MKVSVVIITYNHAQYLHDCIAALLNQTYPDFEIVIIDDSSTDNTSQIVDSYKTDKIRYVVNTEKKGLAALRNQGIMESSGEYVFFTDADCEPVVNWIDAGMSLFHDDDCAAVEGKTIAEHQNFGASSHFVENTVGGQYQTCNIAYRRDVLIRFGMFNEKYSVAYEDVDLAIRIKKEMSISFSKHMIVFHKLVPWSIKGLLSNALRAKYKVLLIKEHHLDSALTYKIMEINSLVQIFFPVAIPLYYRIMSVRDVIILPFIFLRSVVHRLVVWKTSIVERIFIL